jgi:hypothetical protein
MKHTEIEAVLERSLRKQVKVPRLDRRFDARVWARIEAQESRATAAAPAATPQVARWLDIVNILGLASVAIVFCMFGAQALAGMELNVSMPEISAATWERIVSGISMGIAGGAIVFGLMFTPVGRRLRDEFV